MEIVFRRRWEAAHRLIEGSNRHSKCSQPHGHSWWVEVNLTKTPATLESKTNILVSFEDAKKTWHEWIDNHIDHSFNLNANDPLVDFVRKDNPEGRLLISPGDPTTEILAALFKAKLEAFLAAKKLGLQCKSLKIEETATNSIIFSGDPQAYLPADSTGSAYWWNRADFSTHDLY